MLVHESCNCSGPLKMGDFCIREKSSGSPTFTYDELASCSAIVFKCENGYAGFHYPARSLLPKNDNRYRFMADMSTMLNTITSRIGKILEVRCFTPKALYGDERERDKDEDEIISFFKLKEIVNVKVAKDLGEVSISIDW